MKFLSLLGDTIGEYDIDEVLQISLFNAGCKKSDDPRNFGVAEIDDDGFISRVVEKPSIPKCNMALVGLYKIKDTSFLFNCLENIITNDIKSYDEFNLTDALECMIQSGAKFKPFKVRTGLIAVKKNRCLNQMPHCLKNLAALSLNQILLRIRFLFRRLASVKVVILKIRLLAPMWRWGKIQL